MFTDRTFARLHFNVLEARRLHTSMCEGVAAAQKSEASANLLLHMKGRLYSFHGFGTYQFVRSPVHQPLEQKKVAILLYRGEPGLLLTLRQELPGFNALCTFAELHCSEMEVAFVHALFQTSPQACWDWHTDNETKGYERVKRTLVVQLSNTISEMEIMDDDGRVHTLRYGQGGAVLFDSNARHRSGTATRGTIKMTLMMRWRKRSSGYGNGKVVTKPTAESLLTRGPGRRRALRSEDNAVRGEDTTALDSAMSAPASEGKRPQVCARMSWQLPQTAAHLVAPHAQHMRSTLLAHTRVGACLHATARTRMHMTLFWSRAHTLSARCAMWCATHARLCRGGSAEGELSAPMSHFALPVRDVTIHALLPPRSAFPIPAAHCAQMEISTGMRIFIVEEGFEVPDYGMPRCEPLRNLVDFLCVQEDSHAFRGSEGPKGEDQFRCVIDSDGAGKPTTIVSLRKTKVGRCEPEDLEYRFDDSGAGRPLEKFIEKLNTVWLPRFANVALTVSIVNKDGSFEACKTDGKFRVRLNFESKDKGIVWCTEPIQTVEALVVGAAKSGRRGDEAPVDAVKRPRGRAPAGKTWDEQKGAWVEEEGEEEEGEEEEGEEEDGAFGVALLRKLSTHELRISALVYTFANGKANTYVAREPLVLSLKKLGTKKPHERLQEARFKDLSRHIVHNGQAGNNTGLALTTLGVQHIETLLNFEENSIKRAVAFLKALYRDERSETHTDVEDTMTPPPKKGEEAAEEDAEEDDKFGAELLQMRLSTHERRICAFVYTFANGQADAYVSRGVLMCLLKGLGVSKPQELLQEARIKSSHNLVHNGQAGINAALALTASGVQYIKTHLDFETGSIERAVTFLKTLYTDDSSAPVTEEDEEANTPPPAKKAKAGKQNPTSADTATSAKRSTQGGEGGEAHAKKLADAAIEAAEATLKSINALEACLKHLHDAYPQDVNTSEVTAECAQAAADFFTQNHRFPTQEEGEGMLAEIKRAHIKDYKIGNVTKAQLEEVLHAVRASKAGPERVKDIAAHFTAVTVD